MFEDNLNSSSPELSCPVKKNLMLYDIVPMAHHKKPILLEK
jgi:hypothetical protein